MNRNVTAIVLCEDTQSSTLLYQYLKRVRGFKRVYVLPLPAGKGCGSQYVREQYASQVRKQRDKAVASVLVVHTVAFRTRELAEALAAAGVPPRRPDEPVALVIPRWETENWLHHFLGRPGVAETESYPKFPGREASAAKPTVDALVTLVDGGATPPANLPSIGEAARELRRLP